MEGTADILREADPLREAARFVCEALDFAPNGFAIVRLDGSCVRINRTLAGWIRPAMPADDVRGVSLLGGDDGSLAAALRRAALGESVVVEAPNVPVVEGRPGPFRLHVMPFRLGGSVQAASVAFEDRSEQALTVEAFEASERRFRLMVDSASDAIAVHRKGILLYVNPAAVRLLGCDSADEVVGRPVLDFVHAGHRDEAQKALQELRDNAHVPPTEQVFVRKDGVPVVVEISASAAPLDESLSSFVFFRDVSRRQPHELQSTLAASVGRDFAHLVAQIHAALERARMCSGDAGAVREALDAATAAADEAAQLTARLTALGRGAGAEPDPTVVDAARAPASPDAVARPGGGPSILICEDEQRLASLTADLLAQYGYHSRTAASVDQTIEALEQGASDFDALLLDVNLPQGSAGRVLERMQQIGCAVPVILTSGYSVEDIATELLGDPHVVHYLAKPYPVEELVDVLARVGPAESLPSAG